MEKEKVMDAVQLAKEVLQEVRKTPGLNMGPGDGSGDSRYVLAVATLASGILVADAKKVE